MSSSVWSNLVVSSFLFPQLCKPSWWHITMFSHLAAEPVTACFGKGWNRLAAQQASFSSHHPVCLPLPWHWFCVGTPNSSDLKQFYPSKFWCIKLLCQLSSEVAWMHSVQMFVHIFAGKCCCTSKSRRNITISQSSDRKMFATCIKKEIGGMPSDQWLLTQLSSWHRSNLPTQNIQVCSHFGGWSTKVSHD